MSEHVYKHLELTGSSTTSIEDAVGKAIAKASKTVRNIQWFQAVNSYSRSGSWCVPRSSLPARLRLAFGPERDPRTRALGSLARPGDAADIAERNRIIVPVHEEAEMRRAARDVVALRDLVVSVGEPARPTCTDRLEIRRQAEHADKKVEARFRLVGQKFDMAEMGDIEAGFGKHAGSLDDVTKVTGCTAG